MAELNTVNEDNLIKLGNIFKEARVRKSLTVRALSEMCGSVSHTEISLFENAKRKTPNPLAIKKLAEVLDLDYIYLFTIIGYIDKFSLSSPEKMEDFIRIPILSDVTGLNTETFKNAENYITLPKHLGTSNNMYAIKILESSMEPTIRKNSFVLLNQVSKVPNNCVGAFLLDGNFYIRRLLSFNNKTYLRSDNNAESPDILVNPNDSFITLGKYVGALNLND